MKGLNVTKQLSRDTGFVPCNDLADAVLKECLSAPGKQLVTVPWSTGALNLTGRLNAIAAIGSGNFGVAKKTSGSRETFKCYYRRSLTGSGFAEIWGTWKAAIIASPLVYAALELDTPLRAAISTDRAAPGQMLAAFIVGALLSILFLPRGLLSLGTQLASASTTAKTGQEAGGLLSLTLGLFGLSVAICSGLQDWSLDDFLTYLSQVGEILVFRKEFYLTVPYALGHLALTAVCLALGANFFWYLSFRVVGAKSVDSQIRNTTLPLHRQALEGWDSTLFANVLSQPRSPVVALVALFYVIGILGTLCSPLISLIWSWF